MATTLTLALLETLDALDDAYQRIEEACDEDVHSVLAVVRQHHLAMLGGLAGFPDAFSKAMREAVDAR